MICDTIMRSQGVKKTKIEDYLLVFKNPEKRRPKTLEESQSLWMAIAGYTPEN